MYLSGYLHRDPSLGNVLLLSVGKEKGFEIPEEFTTHLSTLEDEEENKENKEAVDEIKKLCSEIEEIVVKMKIPDRPCAVIGDGDLAVCWKDYFSSGRRMGKSVSHSPAF